MATIRDVAKLANVSVATVSRVLNNTGYVGENTRQRVEEAIEQLNYVPSDVARSLFRGKSKMIALFVPDIMNPYFPELARAVEDVSNKHEYTFVLCNTDDNLEKELAYLNALRQKSIDGIIIVSSTITEEHIENIDIPIIALDRKIKSSFTSVTVNNREGAKKAVQHLKEIGCKRIAHIQGPENVANANERMKGYLEEVEQEKWFSSEYIRPGNYEFDQAFHSTKELLTNHPEIDGIFVANDFMGVGVLKAADTLGIKVPEDLSVIAFDGISLGETTTPSLTTMAQPIYEIGKRASEMLFEKIENPDQTIDSVQLKVSLVERQSTRKRR